MPSSPWSTTWLGPARRRVAPPGRSLEGLGQQDDLSRDAGRPRDRPRRVGRRPDGRAGGARNDEDSTSTGVGQAIPGDSNRGGIDGPIV